MDFGSEIKLYTGIAEFFVVSMQKDIVGVESASQTANDGK